jgi:TolA-binding protein
MRHNRHQPRRRFWQTPATAALFFSLFFLPACSGSKPKSSAPPKAAPPSAEQLAAALPLERPEAKIPDVTSLGWRGSARNRGPQFVAALDQALDPYRSGDYAGSTRLLQQMARNYPDAFEVRFYLGICALLQGHTADAIASLEKAQRLGSAATLPEATWYLAVANARQDQPERTKALLQNLCDGRSSYRKQACSALDHLNQTPSASTPR